MNRKDYTRLIHIARNQCTRCPACGKLRCREEDDGVAVCGDCGIAMEPLSEDRYRQLLRTVAGADSCRFLDEAGLEKVYALFTSCGFRPRTGGGVDRVERDWQEGRRSAARCMRCIAAGVRQQADAGRCRERRTDCAFVKSIR